MTHAGIERALETAAALNPAPGFVTHVTWADGRQSLLAQGSRAAGGSQIMTPDTLFWIASFTKLVTTVVALQLIEEGVLALDQPVASWRAEFAKLPILDGFDDAGTPRLRPASDVPTLHHLLTHTSGLGYPFMDGDLARYAEVAKLDPAEGHRLPRRFEAGARWQYGVSTDWLGMVIEAACGEGLDAVCQSRVFAPLGMTDTTFSPDPAQRARVAGMHARLPDGGAAPISLEAPPPPNPSLGGGGLYSTATDYMRLLRALLDGKVLSDASRKALFTNQIGDLEAGVLESSMASLTHPYDPMPGQSKRWSLGLMVNTETGPDGRPPGCGAWAGLFNCYYWLDPTNGVAALLLAQVLPFADPKVLALFSALERAVYA